MSSSLETTDTVQKKCVDDEANGAFSVLVIATEWTRYFAWETRSLQFHIFNFVPLKRSSLLETAKFS